MTTINNHKQTLDPVENSKGKKTPAKVSDGKTSREQAASTDERQALDPSDDDDLFNNMPV